MKKHEACYWLNELANGIRSSIKYDNEELAKLCSQEPDDEENARAHEASKRYRRERLEEREQQLKALDIAGDALTK